MVHNASPAQLRYLLAATDHDSWADAAASLGVSGSAFSQGIAELERRLKGIELFVKDGRRRVPTESGQAVARHARRILDAYVGLEDFVESYAAGESGAIRAGMIDTAAIHHFGDALMRFRALHPDVEVRLTVLPSAELFDQLRSGDLDIVVAVAPDDTEGLTTRALVSEPLNIYAPPGRVPGPPNAWGPWVGFPEGSRTRRLIQLALRERGAGYDVVAESSQPAVLREMVRLGMGFTVLVPADAEREPHALQPAFDTPLAERVLVLAQHASVRQAPALERFSAVLISDATIDGEAT